MPTQPYPFPFHDFKGDNDRAELAEGVAFNKRLAHLTDEDQQLINDLIHEYMTWIAGPTTVKD